MKVLFKLIKILGIIFLIFILFSIITVGIAKVYEDELASYTIEKLENEINAPMSIGKVSLIPLFSFPNLSAEINELYIGDPQSNENDTLFYINSLKAGLNSWDLIYGTYTIDKLEISGLDFEYTIDSSGKTNLDFFKESFGSTNSEVIEDTTQTSLDLNAEKFILKDIHLSYFDNQKQIGVKASIPEVSIKAKTQNNIFKGKADGSFSLKQCRFEDTKLDQMESCLIAFDMQYEDNKAKIEYLSIKSEGVDLEMEGTIINDNNIGIDANVDIKTLDFDILKKYVPEEYIQAFKNAELANLEPIRIDLNADYIEERIAIHEFMLSSDGIDIGVRGTIDQKDTLNIDADIHSFKLDLAVLKNYIPSLYMEEYGITDLEGTIDATARINGPYFDSIYLPLVDANTNFKNISIQTIDYPPLDTINLVAQLSTKGKADLSEASLQISNAKIATAGSRIQFDASIEGIENPKYKLYSNLDINLEDFSKSIPDSLATNMSGNLIANMRTSGVLPDEITDDYIDKLMDKSTLSMHFDNISALLGDTLFIDGFSTSFIYSPQKEGDKKIEIEKLRLKSEDLHINLKNSSISANVLGKLSEPQQMGVQLNAFNIQNGNIRVFGNGSVNNFEQPDFDLFTSIDLQLNELTPFVPDSLVKSMSGFASAKISSKGSLNLDSLEVQMMPILFENSGFELTLVNGAIAFVDSTLDIDQVSGRMELSKDLLSIPHFTANYNGVKMEVDSTEIQNIYKAVLLNQQEELYVKTHIKIGDILFDNFRNLMTYDESESTSDLSSSDSVSEEPQNWTYLIHGSASVGSIIIDSLPLEDFTINKLHIDDMSTLFKLSDSSYIMDQFKLSVFEGEMNNSVHYKLRKDGTQTVSTHNIVSNMNMRTLLQDMDNFGLDSLITYENISGLLSTDINTFVPIDDSVRLDKMMISGDLILEKGGVYNYAPAQEISKFTGIKELDNIQFKTLRSNIFMFKNKLYVPRTNIVSNAIDIAAFGMQSLDGDSEYHMEIHLSNILFGKSKKRNKQQEESGEEIDKKSLKKSSRKIKYAVNDGKSKVGLDSKDSRDDMMNKIRVQNKMLDFIFFPKNIHYETDPE